MTDPKKGKKTGAPAGLTNIAIAELVSGLSGDVVQTLTERGASLGPIQQFMTFLKSQLSDEVIAGGILAIKTASQTGLHVAGTHLGWSPLVVSGAKEPVDEFFDALQREIAQTGGGLTLARARQLRGEVYTNWAARQGMPKSYIEAELMLSPEQRALLHMRMMQFPQEQRDAWQKKIRDTGLLRALLVLDVQEWESYIKPRLAPEDDKKTPGAIGDVFKKGWGAIKGLFSKETLGEITEQVGKFGAAMEDGRAVQIRRGDRLEAEMHQPMPLYRRVEIVKGKALTVPLPTPTIGLFFIIAVALIVALWLNNS